MNCPICSVELVMSERQGIEIDYCPKCRGVWLDRGELDKIIEKSVSQNSDASLYQKDFHGHQSEHYNKKHKHKSFLHELFD